MAARIQNLKLPPELTQSLILARVRVGLSSAAEIEESSLAAIEAQLEARLPTVLLGTFVALDLRLSEIVRLTDEAHRRGLAEDYLAFASGQGGYWCIRGGGARGAARFAGRWSPGEDDLPYEECEMARWVRRTYGLQDGPTEAEREEVFAEMRGFRVRIRKPKPGLARVVHHPKFGEGLVLREYVDGNHKLEIQFESGVRTILARFVIDALSARVA